ncbi:polysaccharide deacetylase family protein [Campylobacter sputorum]|uniref:polysaccharide deacetylase family protein n=1 Tax=Campylobacter sputorum TaxID=206 RepID=UPI00053BEC29|nr:polysaccharide deacetylase family protein [Campylobacter sputorum]
MKIDINNSVPVLMYHHILPKSGFITSSVDEFDIQMKYLCDKGYKTLTSNEFMLFKQNKIKIPKKSVLITFDDGWRDNFYYAYPILKKYNLKATLFIVSGWIEKSSNQNSIKKQDFTPMSHSKAKQNAPHNPAGLFLNWDEIEKMADVFDFHSHTNGHFDDYFEINSLEDELIKCKDILKTRLGFDDTHLCWPRGIFDDEKLELAKKLGYKIFYTTKRGINLPDNSLTHIKRISIKSDDKWLKKTMFIYSNSILGYLYSKIKS